jgi:hypothetical protein
MTTIQEFKNCRDGDLPPSMLTKSKIIRLQDGTSKGTRPYWLKIQGWRVAFRCMNFFGRSRSTLKSCLWVTPGITPDWLLLGTPGIGDSVTQVPSDVPYSPTTFSFGSLIRITAEIMSFVGSAVLSAGGRTGELGLVAPKAYAIRFEIPSPLSSAVGLELPNRSGSEYSAMLVTVITTVPTALVAVPSETVTPKL